MQPLSLMNKITGTILPHPISKPLHDTEPSTASAHSLAPRQRVLKCLDDANLVGNVQGIVILCQANVRLLLSIGPGQEKNKSREREQGTHREHIARKAPLSPLPSKQPNGALTANAAKQPRQSLGGTLGCFNPPSSEILASLPRPSIKALVTWAQCIYNGSTQAHAPACLPDQGVHPLPVLYMPRASNNERFGPFLPAADHQLRAVLNHAST